MELEVLIIIILCATKCTSYAKVNGDLLKVKYGDSGIDYDTLTSYIKNKEKGFKKQADVGRQSSGDGDVYVVSDNENSSGDGSTDDEGSGGSGDKREPLVTTVPPTFKISTAQSNLTSPSVVLINTGSSSVNVEDVATKPPDDIDPVKDTPDDTIGDNKKVITGRSSQNKSEHGVKFTLAIIVGIVVGAVLSILIIVFLVYRLRKKDGGSYSLDKQTSAMLQTEADSPTPKEKGGEYIV